jgi:hypothetical protein
MVKERLLCKGRDTRSKGYDLVEWESLKDTPRNAPNRPQHSEDFRCITCAGQTYTFSTAQATVVRQLWTAWENGMPG